MPKPIPLNATKLSTILTVDDLGRSIRFYEELGMTIDQRWEEGGKLIGVMMAGGSAMIGLSQDDWAKGKDRVKGGGLRIWIDVEQDVDQLAANAKAAGVVLESEPQTMPWGARAFGVKDPDGFGVTISREP